MNTKKLFSHPVLSIVLCTVVCALWGSLYPCIKAGYGLLGIDTGFVPSVILFAGIRFLICGTILTAGVSAKNKKFVLPLGKSFLPVFGVAITTIVIHYSLSYSAISMCEASKTAILKQIGYLFISCFAFIFVKTDKFTVKKVIGGILGFLGIIIVNLNGLNFSMGIGEIIVILASFFSVAGTVISKKAFAVLEPAYIVAHSQLMGGIILTIAALVLGGRATRFTAGSVGIIVYICFASIVSYLLWNMLLKYNDISKMSIIKYLEPIFGTIFSGIIVKENVLRPEYFAAFAVIAAAILVSNVKLKKRVE